MIRVSFLFVGLSVMLACQQDRPLLDVELHRPHHELNIGEYSLSLSPDELLTFVRNPDSPYAGLVRYHLPSESLRVIDPKAREGVDLLNDNGRLVYRIDQTLVHLSEGQRFEWDLGLQKLRSFHWHDEVGQAFFVNTRQTSSFACFNADGELTTYQSLEGRWIQTFRTADTLLALVAESEGLFLVHVPPCSKERVDSKLIKAEASTEWAWLSETGLSFLSHSSGVFYYVDHSQSELELEVIDGVAGQTYRGMDIADFDDGDRPGFLYLDAWELQLRIARYNGDRWESQRIVIPGSLGFFNQVLDRQSNILTASTNSFRTQLSRFEVSDDDLIFFRYDLNEQKLIDWPDE